MAASPTSPPAARATNRSGKMRLYGLEGYASLDFATKQGTLIRPSEPLLRGELELEGVDITQPAAVKEQIFGKILRVDRVQTEGREPLAVELEDFVQAAKGLHQPRVSGHDGLRALRLADQVLESLNAHRWDRPSDTPIDATPMHPSIETGHSLRGPIFLAKPSGSANHSQVVNSSAHLPRQPPPDGPKPTQNRPKRPPQTPVLGSVSTFGSTLGFTYVRHIGTSHINASVKMSSLLSQISYFLSLM